MSEVRKQPTIMVVDVTPANLKVLGGALREKGYRVLSFPRGDLALKAAAKNPPDLILLDIMMPGMDGFEVCNHLKKDKKLKNIPVLFISALTETADKVRAFSTGGVDYVTKPFQFEEVYARVETHLKLRELQRDLEKYNRDLEGLVQEKIGEIAESQLATIFALAKLAERRDDDTGQHIERTRTFCKVLVEELRKNPHYATEVDDVFVETIFRTAPLHDIGKVGIPDHVLLKPGKLDPQEWEIMKTHAAIGAQTLKVVRVKYPRNVFISMGVDIAQFHHEKWDGSGYPDGLAGEAIPLSARIMALADVYDALRSKRPYKEPFPHELACQIIGEGNGNHFDPGVVEAFVAVKKEFEKIRAQMDDI